MWTALLSLAVGLVSGVVSKLQHDDYADKIRSLEMKYPEGMKDAEAVLQHLAKTGLPGEQEMKDEVMANLAQTLQSGREISSPSALIGLLNQASSRASSQLRNIDIKDEEARLRNSMTLANFFATVKAPMEWRMEQFKNEQILAAEREEMAGTSELLSGITQGVGGAISAYGMEQQNQFNKDYLKVLSDYWKTADAQSTTTTPGSTTTGGNSLVPGPISPNGNAIPQDSTSSNGFSVEMPDNSIVQSNPGFYKGTQDQFGGASGQQLSQNIPLVLSQVDQAKMASDPNYANKVNQLKGYENKNWYSLTDDEKVNLMGLIRDVVNYGQSN